MGATGIPREAADFVPNTRRGRHMRVSARGGNAHRALGAGSPRGPRIKGATADVGNATPAPNRDVKCDAGPGCSSGVATFTFTRGTNSARRPFNSRRLASRAGTPSRRSLRFPAIPGDARGRRRVARTPSAYRSVFSQPATGVTCSTSSQFHWEVAHAIRRERRPRRHAPPPTGTLFYCAPCV
jgi:hypothetical protein